jgi:anti-sigma factor RsiW
MTINNERPICHRAEDLVAYLYNEANEIDAKDFADHAEICDACGSELAAFRRMHESIVSWRQEALGAAFNPARQTAVEVAMTAHTPGVVQPERKLSALQALREFFTVSPLWLRGAAAFAGLLLCALTLIVVNRSWNQPAPVAMKSTGEKVYTDKDFKAAVEKEVNARINQSGSVSPPSQNLAVNGNQTKIPNRERSTRRELASNSAPPRSRRVRGLTRAEREQLAADLRLIPGREETDLPFLFSEEPN